MVIQQTANFVPLGAFSAQVFFTLLAVFVLSAVMFFSLARRMTSRRRHVELSDWAKARGFSFGERKCAAPAPLDGAKVALRVGLCLSEEKTAIYALESIEGEVARFHVLVREIAGEWKTTGLRPAGVEGSLLDLFSLSSFPALGETDRFVIYGVDSSEARRLHKTRVRGLLPPDIGVLLAGRWVMIDFSRRPLDPLEFDRMIALVEQLVGHLPMR